MDGLDVRWDGISHQQIVNWTTVRCNPSVTELLEKRLKAVAEALGYASDLANETLQRVNGGEWTGSAASAATQAMRVMRDFDDILGHHGAMNSLAAYGQSDNASWVRANMPAVVDARAAQVPTGNPIDILNSTVDYQHQLQAAKDAEEQARQVMREYQSMTTQRIAAFPVLSPAPQLVLDHGEDTVPVSPGDDGSPGDQVAPRGGNPVEGPPADDRPPAIVGPPERIDPSADGGSRDGLPTDPAGVRGNSPPVGVGSPGETARPVASGPGVEHDNGRTLLYGGQPAAPRPGDTRVSQPSTATRARRVGTTGLTPVGTAGARQSDEDNEHQVKYGVPGSEIFEPDSADGLLFDPFRPGSFVAPSSIGDDDDE